MFNPTTSSAGVVVENSTVAQVHLYSVAPQGSTTPGTVVNAQFNDDTFPAVSTTAHPLETFINNFGGPATFAINGGTWNNSGAACKRSNGLFFGANTAYTVSDLTGYSD
jgi:hypothetical protein